MDPLENKYVKLPDNDALTLAVQKLQLDGANQKEWFISAPGKVILFGEHAVVHGVVSHFLPSGTGTSYGYAFIGGAFIDHNNGIACTGISKVLMKSNSVENPLLTLSPPFFCLISDCHRRFSGSPVLWAHKPQERRQNFSSFSRYGKLLSRMGRR